MQNTSTTERSPTRKRRAISDSQKGQRRRAILDAALALFDDNHFEQLSMAQVATRAGLAKGTLYLYFPTREALFLALLTEQFEAFFRDLDAVLGKAMSQTAFVDYLAQDLQARPRLLRLIAIMHTVLERNIDLETAAGFKRFLAHHTRRSGVRIEQQVRGVPTGFGQRLLLWLHALAIGLHHMATPAPVVHEAINADAHLAMFAVDFGVEMRDMLMRLLRER